MKTFKMLTTCIMMLWLLLSVMITFGEQEDGTILKNIILGGVSTTLCLLLWRELYRRGLIINDNDDNDDDLW